MWPFRRKARRREREIGEAEAYQLLPVTAATKLRSPPSVASLLSRGGAATTSR
jgi:hypothetical protein